MAPVGVSAGDVAEDGSSMKGMMAGRLTQRLVLEGGPEGRWVRRPDGSRRAAVACRRVRGRIAWTMCWEPLRAVVLLSPTKAWMSSFEKPSQGLQGSCRVASAAV